MKWNWGLFSKCFRLTGLMVLMLLFLSAMAFAEPAHVVEQQEGIDRIVVEGEEGHVFYVQQAASSSTLKNLDPDFGIALLLVVAIALLMVSMIIRETSELRRAQRIIDGGFAVGLKYPTSGDGPSIMQTGSEPGADAD